MRLLGEAVGSDRCTFVRSTTEMDSGRILCRRLAGWSSEGTSDSAIANLEHELVEDDYLRIESDLLTVHKRLEQGEIINFIVDELPETFRHLRCLCELQGTTSKLVVPIFVQAAYWGRVYFDNCGEPRLFDEAKISILKIAADSIAAAIERQAKEDELLQIEQARSQELEHHNAELQEAIEHEVELRCQLCESEERYRTLFEISNEGIFRVEFEQPISLDLPVDEQVELLHRHRRVAEANATFAAMYGRDNPEDLIGLQLDDIQHTEKKHCIMQAIIENGYQIRNAETEEADINGNPCYFLNNLSTIIKDGYAIGIWASKLDITELRLAQQALLEAEQERSAALTAANAALQAEIIARQQAEQVSRGQTEALVNALATFAQEPILGNCLGYMLQAIVTQLGDCSGGIYLYSEAHNTLLLHLNYVNGQIQHNPEKKHPSACTFDLPHLWDQQYIPLLKQRQILIQDVGQYPRNVERGIKQILVVPLLLGDSLLGIITLRSQHYRTYRTEELELPQALAHQATLAIQLTRLAKQGGQEAEQAAILAERNRLAREIHDTLAQCLTGVIVQLQAAIDEHTTNLADQQVHLNQAIALAKNGLTEARRSVKALRPRLLEDAPLEVALEQLTQQMMIGTSLETNHRLVGLPYSLSPLVEEQLFRMVQEALTNVLKHANASQVEIELGYQSNQMHLRIKDNGQGFNVSAVSSGYGLIGMQERAEQISAQLTISSQPGQGTCLTVVVPTSP